MPYRPPLYGIFWGHIFCKYWGGGGQNYFHGLPWFLPNTKDRKIREGKEIQKGKEKKSSRTCQKQPQNLSGTESAILHRESGDSGRLIFIHHQCSMIFRSLVFLNQKRPFVHNSVSSQFWGVCLQFLLSVRNSF